MDSSTKETLVIHNTQFQYLIEGHLVWFQCAVIKRREIETIGRINSVSITKLGWQPTLRLEQSCVCLVSPSLCNGARLLCPWDSPGKDTPVGCLFLLQRVFPTQGSNPHLLQLRHCIQILHWLSHQGSPEMDPSLTLLLFKKWAEINIWAGDLA